VGKTQAIRRESEQEASEARPTARRELLTAWAHLAVLWAFAFAQPLFEVLADSPDFFVARRNTGADIVTFSVGFMLVPPTILLFLEAFFLRLPRVRRGIHLFLVGLLLAAIALQILTEVWSGPSAALVLVAIALGAAGGLVYTRGKIAPTTLTYLAPAPLVILGLFLLSSPVSKLVLPGSAVADVPAAQVRSETPIVIVLFDEFASASLMNEEQAIDASRYPHFAELAKSATWYRNATSVADNTTRAVPAIVTGRLPKKGVLARSIEQPRNLFTLLGEHYEMNVQEPESSLCPR
jgi:hypothetical protein